MTTKTAFAIQALSRDDDVWTTEARRPDGTLYRYFLATLDDAHPSQVRVTVFDRHGQYVNGYWYPKGRDTDRTALARATSFACRDQGVLPH